MLTRRSFLRITGASVLAASTGCSPRHVDWRSLRSEAPGRSGLSLAERTRLAASRNHFLGYPINLNRPPEEFFAWREELARAGLGQFGYNNVGSPYKPSTIPFNTHDFERDLIAAFGRVYGFASSDLWGFLSNSGTDSNMHGMYIGRTLLKGRTGLAPRCYYTREAHYSIQILSDLLGLESVDVAALSDGAMDVADLARKLADHRDRPALIVATVGTTFKGAIDPVAAIRATAGNFPSYLHVDAALFGGYLPHTAGAGDVMEASAPAGLPPRYDSIAVSCHKFFGFPSPAGLFLTRRTVFDEFLVFYTRVHNPEYIGHVPGTITCSRDAVKPAEFHFFSTPSAIARQRQDAAQILANTTYLFDEMRRQLPDLRPVRASDLSNTIYFLKPADRVVAKYSLATMRLSRNGTMREHAHVVVMPHAGRDVLSELLTDLATGSARTV